MEKINEKIELILENGKRVLLEKEEELKKFEEKGTLIKKIEENKYIRLKYLKE